MSTPPFRKDDIVRSIVAERQRSLELLRSLAPEAFDTSTALPGWRVRDVVAHLVTTDRASVTGSLLPPLVRGQDAVERWNEKAIKSWADRPVPELLAGLDTWGKRFVRLARTLPGPAYRLVIPGLYGRMPAGILLWARTFDEWVHRQDIRMTLGLPIDQVDAAPAAELVLRAASHMTTVHMKGTQGRVVIALTGETLPEWGIDLGAGTNGPLVIGANENPAVRIEIPARDWILAASGRSEFDQLRTNATLTVTGNEELATRFLSQVRVV